MLFIRDMSKTHEIEKVKVKEENTEILGKMLSKGKLV